MSDVINLTREGYDKLVAKLHNLKTKGRTEVAHELQKAREMGDLSENAEYDAAKDRQGLLELEISRLEEKVAKARIIDTSHMEEGKVYLLSTVKIQNLKNKREATYTLVSQEEADLKQGKISVESPVGKALLGKSADDEVMVQTPGGEVPFKILSVKLGVA